MIQKKIKIINSWSIVINKHKTAAEAWVNHILFSVFYDSLVSLTSHWPGESSLSQYCLVPGDNKPLSWELAFVMPSSQCRTNLLHQLFNLALMEAIFLCTNHHRTRFYTAGDCAFRPEPTQKFKLVNLNCLFYLTNSFYQVTARALIQVSPYMFCYLTKHSASLCGPECFGLLVSMTY